jgi:hypothetical protein
MSNRLQRTATLLLALGLLAPAALAREVRLSARVNEPFELNGRSFPASAIVVEHVREYTPSSALSEVWVGTEFIGLLRADRVEDCRCSESTSLSFERNARGTLVLVGYSSATHSVHGEFRFHAARVEAQPAPAVAQAD